MEPAVKALFAQVPDLKTDQFDIFGCTSTLGSLVRFLKNHDKTFRFTVETVGRTVFFVHRKMLRTKSWPDREVLALLDMVCCRRT